MEIDKTRRRGETRYHIRVSFEEIDKAIDFMRQKLVAIRPKLPKGDGFFPFSEELLEEDLRHERAHAKALKSALTHDFFLLFEHSNNWEELGSLRVYIGYGLRQVFEGIPDTEVMRAAVAPGRKEMSNLDKLLFKQRANSRRAKKQKKR